MENGDSKKELIPSNEQSNFTIASTAQQLEVQKIKPDSLSKEALEKCAMLFKSRGYSNNDIAEILDVDERTVYRYIKKIKTATCLEFGVGFQQKIMTEVINNWRTRCHRLLRLSYSDELTKYEQARAIFMWHQVEMDGLAIFEKLGYLSKGQASADIDAAVKSRIDLMNKLDDETKEKFFKLTLEQRDEIEKLFYFARRRNEISGRIKKIIDYYIKENEKNRFF